jgi:hypothetical protein
LRRAGSSPARGISLVSYFLSAIYKKTITNRKNTFSKSILFLCNLMFLYKIIMLCCESSLFSYNSCNIILFSNALCDQNIVNVSSQNVDKVEIFNELDKMITERICVYYFRNG